MEQECHGGAVAIDVPKAHPWYLNVRKGPSIKVLKGLSLKALEGPSLNAPKGTFRTVTCTEGCGVRERDVRT